MPGRDHKHEAKGETIEIEWIGKVKMAVNIKMTIQKIFDNLDMEMSTEAGHNISKIDYHFKHELTLISWTAESKVYGDAIINQWLSFLSTVIVWMRQLIGRVPCLKQTLEKSHYLDLFTPIFARWTRV